MSQLHFNVVRAYSCLKRQGTFSVIFFFKYIVLYSVCLPTVLKVHGTRRVQRLRQQLHQCHGSHQEGLHLQTCVPGLLEGKLNLLI